MQFFSDLLFKTQWKERRTVFLSRSGLGLSCEGRVFCPLPRDALERVLRVKGKRPFWGGKSPCPRESVLVGPRTEQSTWKEEEVSVQP